MKKQRVQNKLIEELERTPIVQIACDKVDISRNTFYRWMKEDVKFLERVNESLSLGTGLVNDVALSNVLSGIKSKDVKYTMYWLNRKHPDFRQPFVFKTDADDLLANYHALKDGEKRIRLEKEIIEAADKWDEEKIKKATAEVARWQAGWFKDKKTKEEEVKEMFEKWKKEYLEGEGKKD